MDAIPCLAISLNVVIPAKAGIQSVLIHLKFPDSRFHGNDESNFFWVMVTKIFGGVGAGRLLNFHNERFFGWPRSERNLLHFAWDVPVTVISKVSPDR